MYTDNCADVGAYAHGKIVSQGRADFALARGVLNRLSAPTALSQTERASWPDDTAQVALFGLPRLEMVGRVPTFPRSRVCEHFSVDTCESPKACAPCACQ